MKIPEIIGRLNERGERFLSDYDKIAELPSTAFRATLSSDEEMESIVTDYYKLGRLSLCFFDLFFKFKFKKKKNYKSI